MEEETRASRRGKPTSQPRGQAECLTLRKRVRWRGTGSPELRRGGLSTWPRCPAAAEPGNCCESLTQKKCSGELMHFWKRLLRFADHTNQPYPKLHNLLHILGNKKFKFKEKYTSSRRLQPICGLEMSHKGLALRASSHGGRGFRHLPEDKVDTQAQRDLSY